MTAHTPGPWAVLETGDLLEIVTGSEGICIATVQTENCLFESALTDARLIAAAPELLAACEATEQARVESEALGNAYPNGGIPKHQMDALDVFFRRAEKLRLTAIAKAEGKS